jgi:hypothetical protein
MKLPVLDGIIDRRILLNYRVNPKVIKSLLPHHLDPIVINGYASACICLLRLKNIGIKYSLPFLRITSENAAHRFLIKWIDNGKEMHGVYIPRRDTDSVLNVWLAGKLFSWPHYMAKFEVQKGRGSYCLEMKSKDASSELQIKAELANVFPAVSMFDSLEHASACFQKCAVGISLSQKPNQLKVIQLKTRTWLVTPLHVQELRSSYFENSDLFPTDQIHFDNALLMENIEHEWHGYSSK